LQQENSEAPPMASAAEESFTPIAHNIFFFYGSLFLSATRRDLRRGGCQLALGHDYALLILPELLAQICVSEQLST
jgi:hypothetical protein